MDSQEKRSLDDILENAIQDEGPTLSPNLDNKVDGKKHTDAGKDLPPDEKPQNIASLSLDVTFH